MLLNKPTLEGIRSGDLSLVFRRWKRPTVKTGGTLKTAIGVLAVDRVAKIRTGDISESDARNAGYESSSRLLAELEKRSGDLYRIEVRFLEADPRIALRESDDLTESEHEGICAKLQRLDSRSRQGAWTLQVLQAIERHPHLAARELAEKTGFEKEWLKTNIRKLKNLGLTISHHPGYELSPRGRAVLQRTRTQT